MKEFQFANWFNNYVIKNELVDVDNFTQLAEDLSNYGDFGTLVSQLNADQLKSLKGDMVCVITNDYISRTLEEKTFGLVKNYTEYATTLQRIMALGTNELEESHIHNLTNGTVYNDNQYRGSELSSKVFEKQGTFRVAYSITDEEWKGIVEGFDGVKRIEAIIVGKAENTMTNAINQLAKRIFCTLIDKAEKNGDVIHVITEFNRECNKDFDETSAQTIAQTIIPYSEIIADRDLYAMFDAWMCSLLDETVDYCGEFNTVYQSNENFTPRDKVKVVLLSKIASRLKYLSRPTTYREISSPVSIETISGWQTTGPNKVKKLTDVATVKIDKGEDPDSQTTPKEHIIDTYENVIGVMYDTDGAGITITGEAFSSSYCGSEMFTNYYHHKTQRHYVDDRFPSMIFVLD